ncbi:MAG: MBL fold metallo-hydrolase [candidate division WOR-3 bacterium]
MIMVIKFLKILSFLIFIGVSLLAEEKPLKKFSTDTIKTKEGEVKITFVGHASLFFEFNKKVIHIDPTLKEADYTKLPKGDLILITHEHWDHFDPEAIKAIRTKETVLILTERCQEKIKDGTVMKNGDIDTLNGFPIEVLPAYNIINKRENGEPFHPKGIGNGYVITFGDKKIYVAGDTENTPEMKALKDIYAAILPMNLPYTMSPQMVADAVKSFKPKVLYLYHRDDKFIPEISNLLKDEKIDLRIK